MTHAHHHRRFVGKHGFAGEFLGAGGGLELADGEVHAAFAQQRLGNGHQAFEQFETNRRHPLAKQQYGFGEECQRNPGRHANHESALYAAARPFEVAVRVFQLIEDEPGMGEQHLAVLGETDALWRTYEERQPLARFQFT